MYVCVWLHCTQVKVSPCSCLAEGRILAHCGISLHNGFLVQVVCLRLDLICGLDVCGSLPQFYFFLFFPNRSNRAFPKVGGGFFVVFFYLCESLCRLQGA